MNIKTGQGRNMFELTFQNWVLFYLKQQNGVVNHYKKYTDLTVDVIDLPKDSLFMDTHDPRFQPEVDMQDN